MTRDFDYRRASTLIRPEGDLTPSIWHVLERLEISIVARTLRVIVPRDCNIDDQTILATI